MKKILIPTDFSANSKNAIRYAMDLFNGKPCNFYLLFITMDGSDVIKRPIYKMGSNILVEKELKTIPQRLKDLVDELNSNSPKTDNHSFTSLLEDGYFLESIRKHVQKQQIDLIIMGTKGASEVKEFFMGTYAGDVITKVESDTLIVPDKTKYHIFKQIVLPIDFEMELNDTILKRIAGHIGSEKAEIKLLYVTKSEIPLFKNVEIQQQLLRKRISNVLPNPVSFHRMVSKKIENGVHIFAENVHADMIVMLSKDYGQLHKLFLDTTVEEVSFKTKIPLLSVQG